MGSLLLKLARRAEREREREAHVGKRSKKVLAPSEALKVALKGRAQVANHERPTLREAIRTVLGRKEMTASDVIHALRSRNWLPLGNSEANVEANVRSALWNYSRPRREGDVASFQRVRRGVYRVAEA